MNTLAPKRSKPITVRRRSDLIATSTVRGETREWVVKDPLSMRYFRLAEHEYYLLNRLDGRIDADRLCREFNAVWAPRTITRPQLAQFLTMVLQAGLVNVDQMGRGRFLHLRGQRRLVDERRSRWQGIPSLRFRGIDPTRCLDALLPVGRAAFSAGGAILFGLLAMFALGVILESWDPLVRELRQSPARLAAGGAWIVAAAVIAMKVFHELAHGLACRRFGGECRELGLMWIFCTPLPYCDVSDAWTFSDKWHRVTVAAAGILAEASIAAVAILCWRYSSPGVFHDVCLFLGIVALANTLLVNGNPLMRFDGYFALCDAIGVPNLAERSARAMRSCLGRRSGAARESKSKTGAPANAGYVVYGICSWCYRVAVLVGISMFVIRLGRSYQIAWAAWLLVAWFVATTFGRSFRPSVPRLDSLRRLGPRRALRLAAIVGLLAAALFVPVRRSMFGSLVVEAAMREPAYVAVGGRLKQIVVGYGRAVQAGEVIALFENSDLEADIVRLDGELRRQDARLKHLHLARFDDRQFVDDFRRTEELRKSLEEERAVLVAEQGRLTLKAGRSGTLLPPPAAAPKESFEQLPTWSGAPLDPKNTGARLESGVLLGEVADTGVWNAVVTVDDGEAARLRVGDQAAVWLESRRESVTGRVESITPRAVPVAPAASDPLRASQASSGLPGVVRYQVTIRLDVETPLCPGQIGEARLDLPPESLFSQAARLLSRTFR